MKEITTEGLETELRDLALRIDREERELAVRVDADKQRFLTLSAELKNRRTHGDSTFAVPAEELSPEQKLTNQLTQARQDIHTLSIKVTEMEAEQAKLVLEAETAKYNEHEARERLALLVKHKIVKLHKSKRKSV